MNEIRLDLTRRPLDREGLRKAILGKLIYSVGKDPDHATRHDWFFALALAVRDRLVDSWMDSTRVTYAKDKKRVYYLSLEFLIGRLLADALHNLRRGRGLPRLPSRISGSMATRSLKVEPDAALGNGGLGRLAACFMDSMATLGIAGFGYGIRYQHGLFKQGLDDGWQVERPEDWLAFGNPWEFERAEAVYPVRFGGGVREDQDPLGGRIRVWEGGQRRAGGGLRHADRRLAGRHVNTLRLWSAQSGNLINLEAFNRGDYVQRGRGAGAGGEHHPRPLPQRLDRGGPAPAPEAGVLLHLGQPAGHRPAPSQLPSRASTACPTRRRSSSTTRTPRSRCRS